MIHSPITLTIKKLKKLKKKRIKEVPYQEKDPARKKFPENYLTKKKLIFHSLLLLYTRNSSNNNKQMKRVPIGCWSGGAYEASRRLRAAAETTSRLRL